MDKSISDDHSLKNDDNWDDSKILSNLYFQKKKKRAIRRLSVNCDIDKTGDSTRDTEGFSFFDIDHYLYFFVMFSLLHFFLSKIQKENLKVQKN